ncbi:MAG: hypothetical protein Q8K32_28950 [Archangium sp.]|nr:hypothetical protein [Archangium sp.]
MKTFVRATLVSLLALSSAAFAHDDITINVHHHHEGSLLDSSSQSRHVLLSLHGVLPYGHFRYGGFPLGAGASLYIPLLSNGFIPPVNDEFGIDFGADAIFFTGYRNVFALWVPVSVLWTFHFTHNFSAYVKAGVALRFWPGDSLPVYPDFVGAVGLSWMFSHSVGLRAEAGYPGIKLGLLFAL